jgi:mannose-6-phosphate isomerase-like protein (cupin superfamily)
MKDWIVSHAAAQVAPLEPGRRSALLMRHGTMSLRYYAPHGSDPQTPHDQDEIYIVAAGSGSIECGPREDRLERRAFGPGDAIFVPAGHVHRFVGFSDDFATWVLFWGAQGGEGDGSRSHGAQ